MILRNLFKSFLQEWLFFGLLLEVLLEDFSRMRFVLVKDDSPRILTTVLLLSRLWEYKLWWTSKIHSQQIERSSRLRECYAEACGHVNKFLASKSLRKDFFPIQQDVASSIAVVAETFLAASAEVSGTQRFIVGMAGAIS